MGLHSLDMGQLGLVSTTSGLQLQVSSSVQINAPEEDRDSVLALVTSAGDDLGQIWTSLAADFHVAIELHLPVDKLMHRNDFAELLAQTLFEAPLWKQLHLEPKAKVVSRSESSVRLQISLDHTAPENHSLRRHKIAQDVPYYDIEPPKGVRITQIHRAFLRMRFSATDKCKRREVSASEGVNDNDDDEMLDFSMSNPALSTAYEHQVVTKVRRTRTTPEITSPLITSSVPRNGNQGYYPPTLKRCHSTSDIDNSLSVPHDKDVFTLFDAGIRYAIATPSRRSLKDIEVVGHESLRQLASICPAIFSPAHLESVSSRTILLPTVSHALTQVCGAHGRSPALRSKFLELSRRCGTSPVEDGSSPTTQDSVSAHLWHSMRAGLFDSDAASRLKPIANNETGVAIKSQETDPQPTLSLEAEVVDWEQAGLDDCDNDADDDEDLFESDGPYEWDEILMEKTPDSSQENLEAMNYDMDDMLLS